ncbi:hypothetical protein B0H67DRAFT_83183 [Lasiosphaeris hirsuta]|uniref:Secreted protein n=1 Tax=Lasiosphaeris hirsuta TaxID=260670 RepID=A0AA40BCK5_9PEZI|nr:hypothetical protein B0H67DRAFT_83183 [Lasiosphaeris hirsuta]
MNVITGFRIWLLFSTGSNSNVVQVTTTTKNMINQGMTLLPRRRWPGPEIICRHPTPNTESNTPPQRQGFCSPPCRPNQRTQNIPMLFSRLVSSDQ